MLRWLFFMLVARPVALVALGLHIRRRERLPRTGPAIVVANHNSHLDTLVLLSLFPARLLSRLRPVGAADYWFANRVRAWVSRHILGVIPLQRGRPTRGEDPFAECDAALEAGSVLLLFPEGSRGAPEELAAFKGGVARLAERYPMVPVIPVYLHGLGKALPRGEWVFVPFFVDVFVGEPLAYAGPRADYLHALEARMHALAAEGRFPEWA